jgi:hypothetical protein
MSLYIEIAGETCEASNACEKLIAQLSQLIDAVGAANLPPLSPLQHCNGSGSGSGQSSAYGISCRGYCLTCGTSALDLLRSLVNVSFRASRLFSWNESQNVLVNWSKPRAQKVHRYHKRRMTVRLEGWSNHSHPARHS